jgi:uncharacterized protein
MKIAIVGSGLAGLAAAWRLGESHDVTIFERHGRLGMAAHSVDAPGQGAQRRIDVPLRVLYPGYYPTLLRLYRDAGIRTVRVNYASSFSSVASGTYFQHRNARVFGLSVPYTTPRAALQPVARRIARDFVRFAIQGRLDLARGRQGQLTLGDYLRAGGYSDDFTERFLLPVFSAICTCSYTHLRSYPARVILEYLDRGVLWQSVSRAEGGADAVVDKLIARVRDVRLETPVSAIVRSQDGIEIRLPSGEASHFDHAIVATQANQALGLVGDLSAAERGVLSSFRYDRVRITMHTDERLMPARRPEWAPVNFTLAKASDRPTVTFWMNVLQPGLDPKRAVFQTVDPVAKPRDSHTLASAQLERPIVDVTTAAAQARLESLHRQPKRCLWFCGSYAAAGVPLLESAAVAADEVADRLLR